MNTYTLLFNIQRVFPWRNLFSFAVLTSLLTLFNNCTDVRLQEKPVASLNAFCLPPPENQIVYNKILFVMDKSGSNQWNDPQNLRRNGNVEAFFNGVNADPEIAQYYKWSYIGFGFYGTPVARTLIKNSEGNDGFNDAATFQNMISSGGDYDVSAVGCTPYIDALELARQVIQTDIEDYPEEESIYNIFFMSDGAPDRASSSGPFGDCGDGVVTNSSTDPFLAKVRNILALSPDRIFLSTAYYSPSMNRAEADGLRYMAEEGNGKFANLELNDKLDFEELRVGPRPEAWMIKRFVVYNMNSGFCSDGTIDSDSDADGLCDKDEILYNTKYATRLPNGRTFDPRNRNSLNDEFADVFTYHFEVLPTGEGLRPCDNNEPDQDLDFLNRCEELSLKDRQANGPTNEWTTEMKSELGYSANPNNPDSDGDGFLDFIEYFQFQTMSTPVDYTSLTDPYLGGMTSETLMIQHRHPANPLAKENPIVDLRVQQLPGNTTEGYLCYNVNLPTLPVYHTKAVEKHQVSGYDQLVHGDFENVVMVYFIATTTKDPNGKGYLYYSFQKLNPFTGDSLDLSLQAFKSRKITGRP